MTEQEWLTSKDPIAMLDWVMQLHFRPSDRKLRLVACACSRLDARGKNHLEAIEAVETHADGHDIDLNPHSNWTIASPEYSPARMLSYLLTDAGFVGKGKQIADILRDIIGNPFQPVTLPLGETIPCKACSVFRGADDDFMTFKVACNVCRNSGRVVGPSPVLTPLVLQLAEAVYTVRTGTGTLDNDVLAVLSDALEEAGLEEMYCPLCKGRPQRTRAEYFICIDHNEIVVEHPILAHLREPGPHYRGCWAVDLLLGKE